ncbi:Mu-like prophage major head subunit gpT family protein [Shewanella sp. KCT]|uniref:Mu-like prophage major head subunit gpT family protein n=1 Tax=Shewanella sp. KCT TaxID=2569535 RepID=UPI0011839FE0|nr:Mu-like prophage major head subunit gpT family protein [Shewanella sp. KCT]TVP15761.1 hypothetical protein AYI87_04665 [Shewanella sp. KCT]
MTTNLREASTAFAARFSKGLTDSDDQLYTQLATVIPSSAASTGYGFLGQIPKIREWVGDRIIHKLADFEYEIKNKLFESTVSVSRTEFEDNDYGKYGILFEDFGREANAFPNDYVFELLANGASRPCFDGQSFFDTDHPIGMSGGEVVSASNYYTPVDPQTKQTPWFLLDTSRVIKPLIWQERVAPQIQKPNADEDSKVFLQDEYLYGIRARGNAGYGFWQLAAMSDLELNADNFNTVYEGMTSLKGDNGSPLRIQPKVLVVPPSLRQKAHEIIKRQYLESGESNINYEIVDVMIAPYL